MDNVVEGEFLTPEPKIASKPKTMDFPEAIRKIMDGKRVARISWGGSDYGFLKDEWLSIYTKGAFHTWTVSAGDMEGQDWVVVQEGN